LPSVVRVWSGADWFEREAYDLFGIEFENHPDLRRLLLPPDWVGFPLRKNYEFPKEYNGISCVRPKLK
jgi:NADH-quinone oxidoreductase subunit C